jgi:hypothetical protein
MGVLREEHDNDNKRNERARNMAELKVKKAWEVARAGFGQGMFMAFMLWMSGSSLQIFSIMMTALAVMQPLRALLAVNSVFAAFNDLGTQQLIAPKIVYLAINTFFFGVGLWQCSRMGLFPSSAADFYSSYNIPYTVRSLVHALPECRRRWSR